MPKRKLSIFLVTAIVAAASISCSYRHTRAFHLEDKLPPRRTISDLIDNLPDQLTPWVVQVRIRSVFESKDHEKIAANEYACGLSFRLPEDTSVWKTDSTGKLRYALDEIFINDTSANVVSVDSVTMTFEPSGLQSSLPARPGPHRSFDLGSIHIPESVDSLTLGFIARLETPEGAEIMRKRFTARFFRWDYRWNDWLPLE